MAGKSGRSINNVPENPMKHIIFSWEGILVILFIRDYEKKSVNKILL